MSEENWDHEPEFPWVTLTIIGLIVAAILGSCSP
jgi:hypothetical protein